MKPRNKVKKYGQSHIAKPSWFGESFHYWPQGALPLARAMALVQVVSNNSERASAIYQEILETWVKPETMQLSAYPLVGNKNEPLRLDYVTPIEKSYDGRRGGIRPSD